MLLYRYETVVSHMENWQWFPTKNAADKHKEIKGWRHVHEYNLANLDPETLCDFLNSL